MEIYRVLRVVYIPMYVYLQLVMYWYTICLSNLPVVGNGSHVSRYVAITYIL